MRYVALVMLLATTVLAQDKPSITPAKTVTKTYEVEGCDSGYTLSTLAIGAGYGFTFSGSTVMVENYTVCISDELIASVRAANKKRSVSATTKAKH
jgi:uncharacterized membrane protein